MPKMVMGARAVSVAVLAGALLAGCSGGSGPATSSTSTTSPSSSSSSSSSTTSSSPPTSTRSTTSPASVDLPEGAKAHTAKGAEAFARFFTYQVGEARHTADSSTLRRLSTKSCRPCQAVIQSIDDDRAKGRHATKNSMSVRESAISPGATNKSVTVDVLAEEAPYVLVRADGTPVAKASGAKFDFRHTMSWINEGWLVTGSELVRE